MIPEDSASRYLRTLAQRVARGQAAEKDARQWQLLMRHLGVPAEVQALFGCWDEQTLEQWPASIQQTGGQTLLRATGPAAEVFEAVVRRDADGGETLRVAQAPSDAEPRCVWRGEFPPSGSWRPIRFVYRLPRAWRLPCELKPRERSLAAAPSGPQVLADLGFEITPSEGRERMVRLEVAARNTIPSPLLVSARMLDAQNRPVTLTDPQTRRPWALSSQVLQLQSAASPPRENGLLRKVAVRLRGPLNIGACYLSFPAGLRGVDKVEILLSPLSLDEAFLAPAEVECGPLTLETPGVFGVRRQRHLLGLANEGSTPQYGCFLTVERRERRLRELLERLPRSLSAEVTGLVAEKLRTHLEAGHDSPLLDRRRTSACRGYLNKTGWMNAREVRRQQRGGPQSHRAFDATDEQATRQAIRAMRDRLRAVPEPSVEDDLASVDARLDGELEAERDELLEEAQRIVGQLVKERDFVIWSLNALAGVSSAELAEMFELSVPGVKSVVQRTEKKLGLPADWRTQLNLPRIRRKKKSPEL